MKARHGVALIPWVGAVGLAALVLSWPSGPTGPAYATSVLLDSVPDPWSGPQRNHFDGMSRFTAAELTRIQWGAEFGTTVYVAATVASMDPEVVSVNPIDDYLWGAAAYSTRQQRCYVIVTIFNRGHPQFGSTLYGRLAPGLACVGTAATPANATSTEVIPE